jgi:hypothetical protein
MKCQFITEQNVQCSRNALDDEIEFCRQHMELVTDLMVEVNEDFTTDKFSFVHITTFDNLISILDQGKIVPSWKFKKIFFSVLFPGDRIIPFEDCKTRFISLLFNPQIFNRCGNSLSLSSADAKVEPCFFNPYWTVGEKFSLTQKYDPELTLNKNLNNLFKFMIENNSQYPGIGLKYQNEIITFGEIELNKYLEGIYIPQDFMPYEGFDLEEFKKKYPNFYFITENDSMYKHLIDFRAFKKFTS